MTATSLHPFLFCADVSASLDFLVRAFGLSPGETSHDDAGAVVNATATLGDGTVFLSRPHPGSLQPANTLPAQHSLVMAYVPDVDAVHERAKEFAVVDYPPQDMPYGQRECGMRDRDGNLWCFATLR